MYTVEDFLKVTPTNLQIAEGRILIAVPFYNDPFFNRSVVLLTDYDEKDCVGLILNKKSPYTVKEILPEIKKNQLLYFGGPVIDPKIFAIHNYEYSKRYSKLLPGIYVGFDQGLIDLIENNESEDFLYKLFVGYSGWAPGQLQSELDLNMWIIGNATPDLIFKTEPEKIWESAVSNLGEKYAHWLSIPEHLSHN